MSSQKLIIDYKKTPCDYRQLVEVLSSMTLNSYDLCNNDTEAINHIEHRLKSIYSNYLEHDYKYRVREVILFASQYSNIDIRVLKDILDKPLFEFDVKEII